MRKLPKLHKKLILETIDMYEKILHLSWEEHWEEILDTCRGEGVWMTIFPPICNYYEGNCTKCFVTKMLGHPCINDKEFMNIISRMYVISSEEEFHKTVREVIKWINEVLLKGNKTTSRIFPEASRKH